MKKKLGLLVLTLSLCLTTLLAQAQSKPLRIASANDPQTMAPHALALLYHTRVMQQLYEGLVNRDAQFRLEPALALSWVPLDGKTWRFKLRPGVKFHDGSAFTADDAVFSIERALQPSSQRAPQMRGVIGARKVDALTVDVLLQSPDAVLPEKLWLVAMMSKAWCEKHGVARPQDYDAKQETHAVRNAMGTGPFVLKRYEADVRTSLVAYPAWWGRATHEGNVDEAQFIVIQSDATRLAALGSGQVDVVLDPPFQDVARLRQDPQIKLMEMPDIGTQYLLFNQHSAELPGSDVRGRNPFKDQRVRRAVAQALDMELIVRQVLRGQGEATGSHVSRLLDGYLPELEKRLPQQAYDPAAARKLLTEAGYPNGFNTSLDCLNVSFRQAVCQAMAAMLQRVGIRTQFAATPGALFFPKLTQASISLAEVGWSPGGDVWNIFNSLVRSYQSSQAGPFNAGRYSNAQLDGLIDAIRVEPDLARRRLLVGDVLRLMNAELPILPIYRVSQIWALRPQVQAAQWPNSVMELRWVKLN